MSEFAARRRPLFPGAEHRTGFAGEILLDCRFGW
jgi:hypothetical protein